MTHIIYIYFIINALTVDFDRPWYQALFMFAFGLPYIICTIAWSWIDAAIWKLNSKIFFISFFKLWFTDRYKVSKISDLRIDYVKERYRIGNWFERRLIEALDRKYGYGITGKGAE